jgi:DEAD/DEAH box helicase domain-containing protein
MDQPDTTDDTTGLSGQRLVETFPRVSLTPESDRVETVHRPARAAETVPADEVLGPVLARAYPHDPFSHQAAALDALAAGENVVVATSTDSGKTHVYALQIARSLLDAGVIDADGSRCDSETASTALCLYPTKALTADQQEALTGLYDDLGLDIRVRVYDGDTTGDRRAIREQADVILTNFAGLNVYLEHHDRWSRFYSALDLVAIDESHTYTGIQGMHVAWILRRLRRVVDYWGGDPTYALTSATIGNPRAHSETLVNAPVTVVDNDGSPRGPQDILLWNPPPQDATSGDTGAGPDPGGTDGEQAGVTERVPASVEAPKVFDHLTARGVRTLLFCESRKLTEVSVKRARAHRQTTPGTGECDHEAYHAGLGRQTRHSREHRFKSGALSGLATTSALELGIDIGDLGAVVLMGYPGQRQSFWQRVGRAGREASRSLAVLVGDHRTLDQYILDHPEYLLDTGVEDAVVDTSNDAVFATHVLAAADELALDETDAGAFADADRLRAALRMWRQAGRIEGYLDAAAHYAGPGRPQTRVTLYGTTETEFRLTLADGVDRERWGLGDGLDLAPVGRARAYRDYHEGAVRLQDGQQFEVVALDEDRPQPVIELEPVDCDYYTRTRRKVTVLDADSERSRDINGFELHFGRGTVLVHHHTYDQLQVGSSEPKRQGIPTGTPPLRMDTQLCWLEVPEAIETPLVHKYRGFGVETGVDPENADPPHLGYVAGLHAAEHATIQAAPLELRVDKADLGGLSTLVMDSHYAQAGDDVTTTAGNSFEAAVHVLEQRAADRSGRPASGWFIYDGVEGGLGFARAIYDTFETLAARARDRLRDCDCGRPNGCPACTFDEQCGNDNRPLLRAAAVDVLDCLLGDRDALDAHRPAESVGGDRRPVVFYS